MAGFNGDIKGLNMNNPSPEEFSESLEPDLAMFTNSSFFDFDAGDPIINNQSQSYNAMPQDAAGSVAHDMTQIDFSTGMLLLTRRSDIAI